MLMMSSTRPARSATPTTFYPARRSTRAARPSSSGRRGGRSNRSAIREQVERDPARKWVQVDRPPAPGVGFLIPVWIPVDNMTPEERDVYDKTLKKTVESEEKTDVTGVNENTGVAENQEHTPTNSIPQTPKDTNTETVNATAPPSTENSRVETPEVKAESETKGPTPMEISEEITDSNPTSTTAANQAQQDNVTVANEHPPEEGDEPPSKRARLADETEVEQPAASTEANVSLQTKNDEQPATTTTSQEQQTGGTINNNVPSTSDEHAGSAASAIASNKPDAENAAQTSTGSQNEESSSVMKAQQSTGETSEVPSNAVANSNEEKEEETKI